MLSEKISTELTIDDEQAVSAEIGHVRVRPKVGKIPPAWRNNDATEAANDYAGDDILGHHKGDIQFKTFLLVLVFVAGLLMIILHNGQKAPTPAPTAPVAAPKPAAATQPTTLQVPAEVKQQAVAPVAPVAQPEPAKAESHPAPAAPVAKQPAAIGAPTVGYVTPVTSETSRSVAAPYQQVTVTDHHPEHTQAATAPAAPVTPAAPVAAAPAKPAAPAAATIAQPTTDLKNMAPAAGQAAGQAPAAATSRNADGEAAKDLLSIISKEQ